jgi:hypothetical protein
MGSGSIYTYSLSKIMYHLYNFNWLSEPSVDWLSACELSVTKLNNVNIYNFKGGSPSGRLKKKTARSERASKLLRDHYTANSIGSYGHAGSNTA